jgi:rod shape determining protein RodA
MLSPLTKHRLRDFDWFLAILAICITLFGTWQIYNAAPTENFWQKQLIGLGIALVAMLFVAFTDYRRLVQIAPVFYVIGLILLVLVAVPGIGLKINGHRSWIKVPLIGQFQPAEFCKVPTVLMLAYYFQKPRQGTLKLKEMIIGGGILALPVALIMLEPDAGSVLTYLPILAVFFFLSAIRIRYVVGTLLLIVITVPMAYKIGVKANVIKGYQKQRIDAILDSEHVDKRGIGYHTEQSKVTIGKGGLLGTIGNPNDDVEHSQSRLKFLPEPHSDFIFAVTSETTGFIGAISLIIAYAILLSKLIVGALRAPDRAGMLIIMGIVGGLTAQIFINIGMALGILPVIGVPLPMMSAGVSSVLSTFIAIGFVVSIRMRRYVN